MDEDVGIVINIKAVNAQALRDLVKSFGQLDKNMDTTNKSAKRLNKTQKDMFGSMTRSLTSVSLAMNDLRFQMTGLASGINKMTFGMAAGGVKIAADTEEANKRLEFAVTKIGAKYEDVIKTIDEVSLKTILTRKDVVNMFSGLAFQKVNAFDSALKNLTFIDKNGVKQSISSLEVLNDAVAFSGKNAKRIAFVVKDAVSEGRIRPGKMLAEDLELSRTELVKWNAVLKSAKGNQDAFNKLMQLMADRVGGVTQSIEGTLNFMIKQFDDFRDKIANEIFGSSLKEITDFAKEVGDEIIKITSDGNLKPIAEAMRIVVAGFTGLARAVVLAVKAIVAFVNEFPVVIGLFFAAASAVMAFTAAIIVMAATIAPVLALVSVFSLLAAALSVISGWGIAIALGFAIVTAVFATLAAGLVAVGGIALANTLKAKGFMDMWERIRLVMAAVTEGIGNMDGKMTHLSLQTANALDEKGLLGLVKRLLRWWHGMSVGFDSFKERWSTFGPQFKAAIQPALDAALIFAENLGIDTNSGVTKGMSDFEKAGVQAANSLAGAFTDMLEVLTKVIDVLDLLNSYIDIDTSVARGVRKAEHFQDRIAEGSIPVPTAMGSFLGFHLGAFGSDAGVEFKRKEDLTKEDLENKSVQESLRTHARLQRKRALATSPAARFESALGEGGDMTGVGAPRGAGGAVNLQSVLGQLSEIREQRVGQSLFRFMDSSGMTDSKGRNSEQDNQMKVLAKLIGTEAAKALVKNPPKILIDGKELTGKMTGDIEFDFAAEN